MKSPSPLDPICGMWDPIKVPLLKGDLEGDRNSMQLYIKLVLLLQCSLGLASVNAADRVTTIPRIVVLPTATTTIPPTATTISVFGLCLSQ
jgi:hypothetical protein